MSDHHRVAVIGSGPSGVSTAMILLEEGFVVDIFDGGITPEPESSEFTQHLRRRLTQGLLPNRSDRRYLRWGAERKIFLQTVTRAVQSIVFGRIHPSLIEKRCLGSTFVFKDIAKGIPISGHGLPRSLAVGGLSNVWGAACYPLRKEDYSNWPIAERDLIFWYERAAQILGICAWHDHLEVAYPLHGGEKKDLPHDSPAQNPMVASLLSHWSKHSKPLAEKGMIWGRSRLAVKRDRHQEGGCIRCGLCFYGCPLDAIWRSTAVLKTLGANIGFGHRPGMIVLKLQESESGVSIIGRENGITQKLPDEYDAVFLAAGPLSSLRIAAETLGIYGHPAPLIENDMFILPLMPAIELEKPSSGDFALSEIVLAMDPQTVCNHSIHMQVYTFSEPLLGPLSGLTVTLPEFIRNPLLASMRNLLMGFIYLHGNDSRRVSASVQSAGDQIAKISTRVHAESHGKEVAGKFFRHLAKNQKSTGLRPIKAGMRSMPLGLSGHLGGTLPMRTSPGQLETHTDGRLAGTRNCFVVDASVFPSMPAQNSGLTIMANAMRIASEFSNRAKRKDPNS
jgi:choline dehydrogenase-like flavoprotein